MWLDPNIGFEHVGVFRVGPGLRAEPLSVSTEREEESELIHSPTSPVCCHGPRGGRD